MNSIYQEKGYKDRKDYLNSLADEYNVSTSTVQTLAQLYGPSEDFDGLISALQDLENEEDYDYLDYRFSPYFGG